MNPETMERRETAWQDEDTEIDLLGLVFRLLDKWVGILAAAVVCAMLMVGYAMHGPEAVPEYTATAKLFVPFSDVEMQLTSQASGAMASYLEIFSSKQLYDLVAEQLGLEDAYSEPVGKIDAVNPANTRILAVTATADSDEKAMSLANAYAEAARAFIPAYMGGGQPVMVQTAAVASESRPSGGNPVKKALIGFVLGAFLACAVIAVQFLMDDAVRTSEDIEKRLGMPVLGAMPAQGTKGKAA